MAGYLASSGALKVRSPILTKSKRGQNWSEQGKRSGQDIVTRMGILMDGHPSCKSKVFVTPAHMLRKRAKYSIIAHQSCTMLELALCDNSLL